VRSGSFQPFLELLGCHVDGFVEVSKIPVSYSLDKLNDIVIALDHVGLGDSKRPVLVSSVGRSMGQGMCAIIHVRRTYVQMSSWENRGCHLPIEIVLSLLRMVPEYVMTSQV